MDSTFRAKVEPAKEYVGPEVKEPQRGEEGEPEPVPYLDYEKAVGHPYAVDHFKLGDTWDDPAGGFPEELSVIEEYLQKQIEDGEIANSVDAIKKKYKGLEKVTGVKGEERAVVRIETIAAYIKFLMETDKIKYNLRRYSRR